LETIVFSFSGTDFPPSVSPARIVPVEMSNVADVLGFQPCRYVDTFRRFLQQGDVGYYAYLDGVCCHRSWLQKGPKWISVNPFVQMKLKKNEGYIHYCETAPWARGKALYPSVLRRIVEDHRGLDNLFIAVESTNASSIRGVEKTGFRERESSCQNVSDDSHSPRLRVVVITQGVTPVLSSLLASRHKIVGIVEAAPRKANTRRTGWQRAARSIAQCAYDMGRRFMKRTPLRLRTLAERENIPYYAMNNGCDEHLESWIREQNPDVIAVYSMSELLKKNIWSLPRLGTINLHPSLLPSYRGPNPFFSMYADMAAEGGATVHRIDDGEDTGDILAQATFPIPLGMRLSELALVFQKRGGALMVGILDALALGSVVGTPQPNTSPTPRAKNLTLAEMWQRIDWDTWPIERIFHCLRYLEPQLHNINTLRLPRLYRWEVVKFYHSSEKNLYGASARVLSCKTGNILLRKRLFFRRK